MMASNGILKWGTHRLPKADRILPAEWEEHRMQIKGLYESGTLDSMMQIMRETYDFRPSKRQYTFQLSKWGIKKYSTSPATQPSDSTRADPFNHSMTSEDFSLSSSGLQKSDTQLQHSPESILSLEVLAQRGDELAEQLVDVLQRCLPLFPEHWPWVSELIGVVSWAMPLGSSEATAWLTFEDTRKILELSAWLAAHDMHRESVELNLVVLYWYQLNIRRRSPQDYLSIILCGHGIMTSLLAQSSARNLNILHKILMQVVRSTGRCLTVFETSHFQRLWAISGKALDDPDILLKLASVKKERNWLDDWLLENQVEAEQPDLLTLYCNSEDFGGPQGDTSRLLRANPWFLRNLTTYWSVCIELCTGRYDVAIRNMVVQAAEIPSTSYTAAPVASDELLQIFARSAPECLFSSVTDDFDVVESSLLLKWFCEEVMAECHASEGAFTARSPVKRWQDILAASRQLVGSSTAELSQRFLFKHFVALQPDAETIFSTDSAARLSDMCDIADIQRASSPMSLSSQPPQANAGVPMASSLDSRSIASLRSIQERIQDQTTSEALAFNSDALPSKMLRRSASSRSAFSSAMSGLSTASLKLVSQSYAARLS